MATVEIKVRLIASPFEMLSKHFELYAAVIESAEALEEHYSTAGTSLYEQEQRANLVLAVLETVRALVEELQAAKEE